MTMLAMAQNAQHTKVLRVQVMTARVPMMVVKVQVMMEKGQTIQVAHIMKVEIVLIVIVLNLQVPYFLV